MLNWANFGRRCCESEGSSGRALGRIVKLHEPLSFGEILKGVGVEEGIERFGRPGDRRNPVAPGPGFDLTDTFVDEGLAQRVAQPDLP